MAWKDEITTLATLQGESSYYEELSRFDDFTQQTGAGLDELGVVLYGVGGTDSDGIVSMGADGVSTVGKSGPLLIIRRFQLVRDKNQGLAEVFFTPQLSTDGGVTWNSIGDPVNSRVTSTGSINTIIDTSVVFATAGFMFRNVWAKSSAGGSGSLTTTGVDDGILIPTIASAALIALGISTVPSASAVIYKVRGFNYV